MTAIERTAYPRFKSQPNLKELAELYTPTESELAFARVQTASKEGRFRLLISLKAFQRLGYFRWCSDSNRSHRTFTETIESK